MHWWTWLLIGFGLFAVSFVGIVVWAVWVMFREVGKRTTI